MHGFLTRVVHSTRHDTQRLRFPCAWSCLPSALTIVFKQPDSSQLPVYSPVTVENLNAPQVLPGTGTIYTMNTVEQNTSHNRYLYTRTVAKRSARTPLTPLTAPRHDQTNGTKVGRLDVIRLLRAALAPSSTAA